jgi:alpha-L-fucosidase
MLGGAGESIENKQILRFINRNYSHDAEGRWFFQNGPQRVFVRIDAAPLVIAVDDAHGVFNSHNGHLIEKIDFWLIDDDGHLFFQSSSGAGQIVDKDLTRLVDTLLTTQGTSLLDWWSQSSQTETTLHDPKGHFGVCVQPVVLERLKIGQTAAARLGFIANPQAPGI